MRRVACALMGTGLAGLAWAQVTVPEGASMPDAAQVKKFLEDRVYKVRFADGADVRLEYKANGYFWVDTSRGFRTNGTWEPKDGQVCSQLKGQDRRCNEVRMHNGAMYLTRDSGEVIQFNPN